MGNRITEDAEYDIRYTTNEDKEYLTEWLSLPEILYWFPMELPEEVKIMANNWIGYLRYKCCLTATYRGKPIAMGVIFLMPYKKLAHLASTYLVVDPNFTGKGVAFSLVKNLKNLGKNRFRLRSLYFELMEDSPLVPLLAQQGFTEQFRQENFFKRKGQAVGRVLWETFL